MVERENSPREHGESSHIIASLLTVLCSTGTILRRKSNGRGSKVENQKGRAEVPQAPGIKPGTRATRPSHSSKDLWGGNLEIVGGPRIWYKNT
jgi:hypothetical protein